MENAVDQNYIESSDSSESPAVIRHERRPKKLSM